MNPLERNFLLRNARSAYVLREPVVPLMARGTSAFFIESRIMNNNKLYSQSIGNRERTVHPYFSAYVTKVIKIVYFDYFGGLRVALSIVDYPKSLTDFLVKNVLDKKPMSPPVKITLKLMA